VENKTIKRKLGRAKFERANLSLQIANLLTGVFTSSAQFAFDKLNIF